MSLIPIGATILVSSGELLGRPGVVARLAGKLLVAPDPGSAVAAVRAGCDPRSIVDIATLLAVAGPALAEMSFKDVTMRNGVNPGRSAAVQMYDQLLRTSITVEGKGLACASALLAKQVTYQMSATGVPFDASTWTSLARDSEVRERRIRADLQTLGIQHPDEAGLQSPAPNITAEAAALLHEYRSVTTFRRDLAGKLPAEASADRLHPVYKLGAQTGRITESLRLQSIPREMRRAIRARPGHLIIEADYSAIEPRIVAQVSGDKVLQGLFADDRDFHAETYKVVFATQQEPSDQQRKLMKALNFSVFYGAGVGTFIENACALGHYLSHADATELRAKYFRQFRGVADWHDDLRSRRLWPTYLDTPGGWRCPTGGKDWWWGQAANNHAQATQATGLRAALVEVRDRLPDGAHLFLCVHDSLLVECRVEDAQAVQQALDEGMCAGMRPLLPSVPVKVKCSLGECWS